MTVMDRRWWLYARIEKSSIQTPAQPGPSAVAAETRPWETPRLDLVPLGKEPGALSRRPPPPARCLSLPPLAGSPPPRRPPASSRREPPSPPAGRRPSLSGRSQSRPSPPLLPPPRPAGSRPRRARSPSDPTTRLRAPVGRTARALSRGSGSPTVRSEVVCARENGNDAVPLVDASHSHTLSLPSLACLCRSVALLSFCSLGRFCLFRLVAAGQAVPLLCDGAHPVPSSSPPAKERDPPSRRH